jgi:hypothetical protein
MNIEEKLVMKKLTISKLVITVASLATLTLATATWAGPTSLSHSEYTPLGHSCKVTWHAAPNEPLPDSFKSICPGRDRMRVTWTEVDARDWIGLLPPKTKSEDAVQFPIWAGFGGVSGTKLEWRYLGSKLVALIVRMTQTFDDETITNLVVMRIDAKNLDQSCIIGKTKLNEEARAIADDLSKICPRERS